MNCNTPSTGPPQVTVSGDSRKRKPEWHHTGGSSKTKRHQGVSSWFTLCETCQKIDFAEIHSNHSPDVDAYNGYEVCDLSYINSESKCALCYFLLRMKQGDLDSRSLQGHRLRAYSAKKRLIGVKKRLRGIGQANDCVVFAVVSSKKRKFWKDLKRGFAVKSSEDLDKEELINFKDTSGNIVWNHIKTWITFCQEHHSDLCRQTGNVPGLTVIDCETSFIIPLPTDDTPYLTLSYMWGSGNLDERIVNGKLKHAPRTINDAITVVRSLGWRYLWIDRYCIPQDDDAEKSRLINLMGDIYKNSTVTIIAAMGSGPDCGLPGVTPGLRSAIPPFTTKEWSFIPQEWSVAEDIERSPWNSRGWTYQEGILSIRRLVFSSKQIYFQCHAMHCHEGIDIPLEQLHTRSLQRMDSSVKLPRALPMQGIGKCSIDLLDRIREFSKRDLSYDRDVLRAFQGILREFKNQEGLDTILSGLPIFSPSAYTNLWTNKGRTPTDRTLTDRIADALGWWTSGGIERRHGFPSWTWAGWKDIDFHYNSYRFNGKLDEGTYSLAKFVLDFGDGDLLGCENNVNEILHRFDLQKEVKFIHVHTRVLDLECLDDFIELDLWRKFVRIRIPKRPKTPGFVTTYNNINLPPKAIMELPCKALIVLQNSTIENSTIMFVAQFPGCSHFERIGLGRMFCGEEYSFRGFLPDDFRHWKMEEIVLG